MHTVFMNSENSKTSYRHRLLLNLPDKINLKRSDKYVALSNLSMYYTWKNIKKSYKNNTFKISSPTWNEKFQLPDGLYSVSNIQDYFENIIKKHETVADNPSIKIYVNKLDFDREFLTPETIKLLASTKNNITKDENGENVLHLEITEVVLVHSNIVNKD